MTQVRSSGVDGATKYTASRTPFVATGQEHGNCSATRPYPRRQTMNTQDPLASQLPERPPSRESITSQDADISGYSAAPFGSQEGLATQFQQSNSRQNMPSAAHTESTVSNNAHNRRLLLGFLDKSNRQKHLPEQQSQRSVIDSSSRCTKKAPTPDFGISTSSNNVWDERPLSEGIINDSRQKPSPEQQSQFPNSSPDSTTSSDLGTNDERDDQEVHFMTTSQSRKAKKLSQGQRKRSISEARSSQRHKTSPEKGSKKTEMDPQDEVASFQVQFSSSSENPAPITENSDNHVNPSDELSDANRTQFTEPAQKEKCSRHDPWSYMTRLRRRDVVIPREQEELLDRNDCWIPPDVGHPYPQGHVPPTLLREWNAKMTRLFADARRVHASSQKAGPWREQEDDPPRSSKPLSEESDSDSEAESEASWPPSPPRDQPKSIAPPDSPTRQNNDRRPAGITENHVNGMADPVNKANLDSQAGIAQPASQVDQNIDSTQGANVSTDDNKGHISKLSTHSGVDIPFGDPGSQGEATELSDDSDMEMAVPQALLVQSQDIASQIEFSGPMAPGSSSTSSALLAQVQILNTPAAALKLAAAKRAENALTHSQEWIAQQSSSGSNKSSSQLIANSLQSTEGSSGQEHQLQDAQRPIVVDSQNTNGDLQGSSLLSHQDSQRLMEVIPDSSLLSPARHAQVSPQDHESPKERVENDLNPSPAMVNGKKLKRRLAELDDQETEESPSKRPRKLLDRTIGTTRTQMMVDVDPDISNGSNHEHVSLNKDALKVYDMFKRSYPKYAGNFDHFQTLCHELQSLYRCGVLEDSSLWDDFIMRYWADYGTYVQKCISSSEEFESYEEFFCKHFTKPSFRKRNLTPRTLEMVVSRLESPIQKPSTVERGFQTIDDNSVSVSVTRRSPLEVVQRSKSTSKESNTQSTPSDVSVVVVDRPHQANIGVKLSALSASPKKRPVIVGGGIQVNLEPPTPDHRLDRNPEHIQDENRAIEETPPSDFVTDENILEFERENTPEDLAADYHDTASIELGLETMEEILISRHDEDGNDPNAVEARFEQISRMRRDDAEAIQALFTAEVPPAPEEEDASTPFKIWARDDHNIVSERRRRGGHEVPLDKNGKIMIEEFPRITDEGSEKEALSHRGRWIWPRRSGNIF
ncbi:hypothetical protein EYB26_007922 [Talaromyces marneffei]|uniref:uncharacterized protein n=1 Tax=Talaromyces marneffei TaxID=37727 RepID=UPI0012AA3FA3|nr:uncharacterized protein EYB26_007922 [Talaromyces marneffei]QGA20220.1 hypothetical protein EYB26_007922 [Talaromyces marneffei]